MKSAKSKTKKPFFKKWWFWLIAFILVVGMFGESEETPSAQDPVDDAVIADVSNTEKPSTEQPDSVPGEQPEQQEQPLEKPEETTKTEEVQTPSETVDPIPKDSTFEIHFIDVGQADAALVLCDGKTMLIDGGNSADSSLIYSYLKKHDVSHLDYIVATHSHEDHVGGLSGALNYATVDTAFCSVKSYDSDVFNDFVKYLSKQNASITVPAAGDSFSLGSATVKILAPISKSDDPNNMSIVVRIVYGDTSFLFTGDAEREEEQDILNVGYDLESTVLKVGHHGSANSTSYPFLREIMPEYAVISVGSGNSYGHPTEEALSRLRDADVKVFRTDMQGHIICTSDGNSVSFTVEKNKDADTLATQKPQTATPVVTPKPIPTAPEVPDEPDPEPTPEPSTGSYIGNVNSHVFHDTSCKTLPKEKNRIYFDSRQEAVDANFKPCGNCKP